MNLIFSLDVFNEVDNSAWVTVFIIVPEKKQKISYNIFYLTKQNWNISFKKSDHQTKFKIMYLLHGEKNVHH